MIQAKIVWGGILLWLDILVAPSFSLFGVMLIMIAIDLVTGIAKAKIKHVQRTSEGYRKTIIKLLQYMVPVLVLWIAGKYIPEYTMQLKVASGFVMYFIIYIEVTSVFENLYEIDQKSPISKYLYKPALKLLKFGIENNPVSKAADKMEENEKANKPV